MNKICIKMYRIFAFMLIIGIVDCSKILCFFPIPAQSHQVNFQPIWKELSLRGHEVTVVTPKPLKDASLKNLREIDISSSSEIWRKHISGFGLSEEIKSTDFSAFKEAIFELIDVQLRHPEVQELMQNKRKEHYDLLIVEFPAFHTAFFKDIYNCPMIGITSMPLHMYSNELFGNPNHPVTHPDYNLPFSRNLTFFQRLHSVVYNLLGGLLLSKAKAEFNEKYQLYWGKEARSFEELKKEFSLVLTNTNPLLNVARANVPAVIEYSGIIIKPEQPLPQDLKKFMDESKEGVVYLSFGSAIESSKMSKNKMQIFLEAFKELPYKILWKFDAETLPGKPENVKIIKWTPQQDVLRHPNLKLFITHGGLQSIDEAMYTKTPLVVLPIFADQFGNARKVEDIGIGQTLRYSTLTKNELKKTILDVISGDYANRSEEYYKILIDKPVSALDKVIWWIEYTIRHKGAVHLKSPSLDIPWYQDYLLDVIGFLVIIIFTLLYIATKLLKLLYKGVQKAFCKVKSD